MTYSRVSFRMTLIDLYCHSEISNDTKHRAHAATLRQLSFLPTGSKLCPIGCTRSKPRIFLFPKSTFYVSRVASRCKVCFKNKQLSSNQGRRSVCSIGGDGRSAARRAAARGPKGRGRGWGSWGGGSQPPPHQLGGLGERCKLPQRGPGRSPGRQRILGIF